MKQYQLVISRVYSPYHLGYEDSLCITEGSFERVIRSVPLDQTSINISNATKLLKTNSRVTLKEYSTIEELLEEWAAEFL